MKVYVGQKLYFWNSKANSVSAVTVTKVSSDGKGFQFSYNGKLSKCTYDYARNKLFITSSSALIDHNLSDRPENTVPVTSSKKSKVPPKPSSIYSNPKDEDKYEGLYEAFDNNSSDINCDDLPNLFYSRVDR